MPGETVKLQVELVEKNAEARLKALDQLAKEMGNRKITLNFDEASLQRWKAATDGMTTAQISAYAKLAAAAENANSRIIAAGQKTAQVEMQQNAKLTVERQKSFDKKIQLWEKEDTKRRQISEKTAQTEINANAKVEAAAIKGAQGTRQQTQAQKELNTEAQKTDSIFSSITARFTAANLVSSLITRGIALLRQALRQAVDEMKEMDKELTTIKMVTGASDSDISNLRQQAFAGARETGRSTSDYLSAAERFARAGYRENIQDLTKLSLVTQNVGGVTEDVASKFLLAADAAWKMGGNTERLWSMLDGVTSIADQNATDIGKIAEAYTVAGSAFANAGESERTFAALIGTTTAATQRSGSEMARGLQTILFRVRQVKGELDDGEIIEADDISNAAKALDSVGISVLNDAKELKSFTEIMGELNEKWDTLNTKQKAYLQNALAGNRRGNVLFSLMDNYDVYMKQLDQYDKASGTALQKNAIYTNSWAAATNNLNTAWTQLIASMTGSGGVLKWITEELANAIDMVNGAGAALVNYKSATDPSVLERIIANTKAEPDKYKGLFGIDKWIAMAAREMAKGASDEKDAVKEAEEAQNALAEATLWAIKVYNDEAEAVDQLSTSFANANANIKKAAENMKDEADSSIKSAADIYKAMKEAADKGYYGSKAYKEGAKLFFGTADKSAIGQIAQDALDTYFDAISEGDYSNAAAALWGNFADESGQIVDKTTGQVIASMRDMGDSYQWAFNKGEQSMDQFLDSLQASTGVGKDFWASMIQSLGMYSDEMDKWMEDNLELPEPELKIHTDSAEQSVQDAVSNINSMLDSIKDKTVRINILQSISGSSVSDAQNYVTQAANKYSYYSGLIGAKGYRPKASGKHDNYSGIALVNDEFPADGSKPELIISKSQGRAYIANGGRPALVNLRSDDVVLTASETKSAFGIPGFDEGKGTDSVTVTTPKNPQKPNKKKSEEKSSEEKDPTENWNQLKKLIDYMIDEQEDILKDNLKVLDDQLKELEDAKKAQQNEDKLAEKQLQVNEALLDLEKAQVERTVRYYNESTQQWEWMADKGALAKAEDAYAKALKDLNDFLADLDFEEQKAAIQAQKDALQEAFDAYKEGWDTIIKAIEAPTGDLAALFAELKENGTDAMKAQADNIESLLDSLETGFFSGIDDVTNASSEAIEGIVKRATDFLDEVKKREEDRKKEEEEKNPKEGGGGGNQSESGDDGAKAKEKNAKATEKAKDVVKAALTATTAITKQTAISSTKGTDINDLAGYAFDARKRPNKVNNSVVNNNGGNTIINGVRIGSEMLSKPLGDVLSTLKIHTTAQR